MYHVQGHSCLSIGWVLTRLFAWFCGTAAVFAQGGGWVEAEGWFKKLWKQETKTLKSKETEVLCICACLCSRTLLFVYRHFFLAEKVGCDKA